MSAVDYRRALHRIPELDNQLPETVQLVQRILAPLPLSLIHIWEDVKVVVRAPACREPWQVPAAPASDCIWMPGARDDRGRSRG